MAYTVVGAVLGTVLLSTPAVPQGISAAAPPTGYAFPSDGPQAPPASSTADSPPPAPPTSTAPAPSMVAWPVPPGYQRVGGPGGLVTAVPLGWSFARSSGPGAMQATDPEDAGRFVRYGGSRPPADVSLNDSHVDYARRFAAAHPGYQTIRLDAVTYRGVPAVEWEFEHDSPGGRRHSRSLYWRVDGVEYFVYAASTSDRWSETESIYRTMTANSTP